MDGTRVIFLRGLVFYSRLFLGTLFVFVGVGKITDVSGFAYAVSTYQILPDFMLYPFAFVLSWFEFSCGLFLLFGFKLKITGFAVAALMAAFLFAVGIALMRGLDIDCGCMDVPFFGSPKVGWHTVLRDAAFLAMALFVAAKGELRGNHEP